MSRFQPQPHICKRAKFTGVEQSFLHDQNPAVRCSGLCHHHRLPLRGRGAGRVRSRGTVALAGMRMDRVRATELYQKLRAQKRFSELDELKAKTGFDASRDVSELLLATNGKEAVTIARGHFSPADPGARKSPYKGYTLNLHGGGAYALIDNATVLAGTQPAVRSAIDQFKTGTRSPP